MDNIVKSLNELKIPYKLDVSAKEISKYKGGGTLRVVACPKTLNHLNALSLLLNDLNLPYFVIGGGSNVLVDDGGYGGVAISTVGIKGVSINNGVLKAGSGEWLSRLSRLALTNSLSGLECLNGIPATLGGAIFMNAGAFGEEIKNVLSSVTVYDLSRHKLVSLKACDIDFGYRSSGKSFDDKIIILAELKLNTAIKSEIESKMLTFIKMRRSFQPIEPSLGCTFKNNNGLSAGFLIDQAGLKGTTVGGAKISIKHANFIVNTGSGTANDYIKLSDLMQKTVEKRFSITLEKEYILLGDNNTRLERSTDA